MRKELKGRGLGVEIVADEWCNSLEDIRDFIKAEAVDMIQIKTPVLGSIHNSIEAALYCKGHNIGTYIGGSCNETDRSAQVSVHIGLAVQADQILAKPGMGVDEGLMIVNNEMNRTLQILRRKGLVKVFKIYSPTAILGYGFPEQSYYNALEIKPDLVAVDAGSTDPGPYYLGRGISFVDRGATKEI